MAIPTRLRPLNRCQIKTPLLLRLWLGREFKPSADEYQELAHGLIEGDLAADALVKHQPKRRSAKGDEHKASLYQALSESMANPPFEVDWEFANQGALFIHSVGTLATDVLRDMALMGGYTLSAFNQTLVLTGELEKGAAPRLGRTSRWWQVVTEPNANKRGGPGFKATLGVRLGHAKVRHFLSDHPEFDQAKYGLPINQVDMAATYLGFSLVMLLGLRKLGIWVTADQSKQVMHLWKIIAWQMGVEQRWLVDTEKQAIVLLRQFAFANTPPDESSRRLAQALSVEPLERQYSRFQSARRRLAYWSHLSSNSFLLGPKIMTQLGIASPLGPFLTPVQIAPRLGRHYLQRIISNSPDQFRQDQIRAINELAI